VGNGGREGVDQHGEDHPDELSAKIDEVRARLEKKTA
jgi:hypothetical protein